ncbi:MAG: hypothetical protein KF864_07325 [Phycisphaeraceae bacterium]|nr:hypothetical protein [Phycisphaeraceae bacterium]
MNASKARSLTTKSEYEVIRRAAPTNIGELSEKQLRAGVAQARKLRDKFKTLADRQRREARGKAEPRKGKGPADNNQNTLAKITLFEQAMERYQAKLEKLAAKVKAEAKAKAAKPARPAAKKRPSAIAKKVAARVLAGVSGAAGPATPAPVSATNTSLVARSAAAAPGRKKNVLAATPSARIRGHSIGAQARAQAKRDNRGARGGR